MQQQTLPETKRLGKDELKALAGAAGPCLSILMPWRSTGNPRENAVRFKQLVQQAEQGLKERNVEAKMRDSLMAPLQDLLDDQSGAGEQAAGIAVYRSADVTRLVWLPAAVEARCVVNDHFFLRPLLAMPLSGQHFYILALSQKHIRLLRCTNHSSEEAPLPAGMPKSLDEFNSFAIPDHNLEGRSSGGPSQGSMGGVHFGTGSESEDKDEYLHHFYKSVDKGIHEIFRNETSPLVLAGVDYETALYRKINSYGHVAAQAVHGAPDSLKGGELHKRALEVVGPEMHATRDKFLAQYDKSYGAGRASDNVNDVVKAAHDGRVSHLFVPPSGEVLGTFDETTDRVATSGLSHRGEEDLLNDAVIQTLLHAGEVYSIEEEKLPKKAKIAALFRY